LEGRYGDEDPGVMCWLRPWLVALAGEMRLVDAVPLLTNFLDSNLSTRASQALQRIGGDVVVREIDARWWHASIDFRRIAANLLNHLRGDSCVERCLAFFKKERDKEAKSNLALALLGNFSEEAIDLIWKFIADIGEEEFEYHEPDLRYRLVAACTIMGRTFPQFDQWRIAALRDNWGRFDLQPSRMADCLKPEQFGPKWSKN
jgi:hypothetical protein